MMSSSPSLRRITMRAPVFVEAISSTASESSARDPLPRAEPFLLGNSFSSQCRFPIGIPAERPMFSRKRLISGWKMTMRAITPTSSNAPNSEDIIFMSSAWATTRVMMRMMMARKMFIADEPRIHLYRKKMITATIRMSTTSMRENCRKLNIFNNIVDTKITNLFYLCA